MFSKTKKIFLICIIFCAVSLYADDDDLRTSAKVSEKWLALVDKGKYGDSWDAASIILKVQFPRKEWIKYLTKTREPLGNVISREVIDQRTANNPPGVPPGKYIVLIYQTQFSRKKAVYELVTLRFSDRGKWQILTYQFK